MDVHENARLTPHCRGLLVERVLQGQPKARIAAQFAVSVQTIGKWLARYRAEGSAGLVDRSSRPQRSPRATVRELQLAVLALRRQRLTLMAISQQLGLSRATVARICARAGLNRLSRLEPAPPVVRYERARPGELLHLDVKKLGRIVRVGHRITGDPRDRVDGAGWEYVHIAIDDTSRVAYAQVLPDEGGDCSVAFLRAAVAYYAGLGIAIREVLTDNGTGYRSRLFAAACRQLGLRHRFTRPYTPRTNGKAERFIQSALREWAYARAYGRSAQRIAALPRWLHGYNWHRPHASLAGQPPVSRLGLTQNNVLRLHN
ncbi:MAG TPA: IS481 family transposase [Steroidobacteraceae bacterium]|nr:IS481 family transposase [Steroidobacteraceae bacterium]